jgi:hypothetical protein
MFRKLWLCTNRGSQRDVVYLGRPIAPSHMLAQMRGGGEGVGYGVSANEYSCAYGAQINFGDLTLYGQNNIPYVPQTLVVYLGSTVKRP